MNQSNMKMTVEDYLAFERASEEHHEYVNGVIRKLTHSIRSAQYLVLWFKFV